jgi:DNA-binding SARP family transcriptional activator/Tfp pilus assembly protein PilF
LEFGRSPRQPIVRIHVLGSMRATTYLGQNILPRGRKARSVLAYLCLNSGVDVSRTRIASLIWDRVPDLQSRSSLRQALRELSAAMGPLSDELIDIGRHTVKLNPGLCWIDALAILSSDPPPPHSLRGELASLCAGQLLEDLDGVSASFDQWLLTERTRFTEQVRSLLEDELQQLDQSKAEPDRRAAMARRFIQFDPTHEGASRILMRALAELGERAQALREYERCRSALRTALDVEPSSETRALYQAIRTFSGTKKPETNGSAAATVERRQAPKTKGTPGGRLRVGVLPFQGDGSPRSESLALSLSQEIAGALSRFRWFDVIAPVSLMGMPASDSAENLLRRKHLNYIVGGSLSGSEEKFQIGVRLLDLTEDSRAVWSDRFELSVGALDQVNELITAPVVARIDPVILFIESRPTRSQRSGAAGLVLQAIPLVYSMEREKYDEAGRLIYQALQVDPDNAMAAAWAAYWQVFNVGQGWAEDPGRAVEMAQELAMRAIRIDPDNAEALGIYAHVCAFLDKDFDSALHYFNQALRLNPNLAFIWALSAPTYCYIGEPEEALRRLERCRDLAPFDPYFRCWESMYTMAYTFKGDYEKAVNVGRRSVRASPEFSNGYKPLIAALGHLRRRREAKPYVEKLLALEPGFTVEHFGKIYPFRKPDDRKRYMQGLLLAGVPEA